MNPKFSSVAGDYFCPQFPSPKDLHSHSDHLEMKFYIIS
jgi:hypothetical protein